MPRIRNYINGELTGPDSGEYLDNVDPSTGAVYAHAPDSDRTDVERAVRAAVAAFPAWSMTPAEERSSILLRIAERIDAQAERLAEAESVDSGKPLRLARTLDIPRAARNFRFFATAILHDRSEFHATDSTAINYTLRRPRGVAGLISPWNLPLYLLSWKIAPALATGNTAVAKPSELTPMTAYLLSEICREVALPPGVLNIVHGLGPKVGSAITAHREVNTISFTGGTLTGGEIAGTAAPMFKKVSLEMGGKNPNIVFSDADLDQAVAVSVQAAFANQGQICLCGSRIFVEQPIYDRFLDRFLARTSELIIGDPLNPQTDQGALISQAHRQKVVSYVDMARREGGRIDCGGQTPPPRNERCKNGFFFEPTVITGLSVNSRVNTEEIFGPVVTITPFAAEQDVVAYANGTQYGLSATIWTKDLNRAHRVADALQCGTVWVNCWLLRDLRVPFGGMKNSGLGREGGQEAMHFFTEPKNVCIRVPPG